MSASTTIPVTISAEAAARIAQLGFQAEVERMLDHVRQKIAELERIEVERYDRYDDGDGLGVVLHIYSRRPFNPEEHITSQLSHWYVREFPSPVLEQIMMDYHPGDGA